MFEVHQFWNSEESRKNCSLLDFKDDFTENQINTQKKIKNISAQRYEMRIKLL